MVYYNIRLIYIDQISVCLIKDYSVIATHIYLYFTQMYKGENNFGKYLSYPITDYRVFIEIMTGS